jgi:hypothetical protein
MVPIPGRYKYGIVGVFVWQACERLDGNKNVGILQVRCAAGTSECVYQVVGIFIEPELWNI